VVEEGWGEGSVLEGDGEGGSRVGTSSGSREARFLEVVKVGVRGVWGVPWWFEIRLCLVMAMAIAMAKEDPGLGATSLEL
jgi:hypothetical protein